MAERSFIARFGRVLVTYGERLGAFTWNARMYLLSAVLTGASLGVFRLLFNFYVLSMGFDEALLGNLLSTSSLTALIAALPMGYLADRLGRKRSLVIGSLAISLAVLLMALIPNIGVFFAMNIVLGLGQALTGVSMGPFLMENSSNKERTYLFSFASGLGTGSAFLGNWIGGYLPTWMGGMLQAGPTSTPAYGAALAVIALVSGLSAIPLFIMNQPKLAPGEQTTFTPLSYFGKEFRLLSKLILPMLITSIGAGLFMPFMNVFFREVHHQPDPVIGAMFAWGSLAMGIGLILAPPIADRLGKIQLVVVTQALSIPFLFMLGFAPWFIFAAGAYYIRLALMNMSGPVYQTFVMERVEPTARATVASLVSMSNSFGWALSPTISGWIQVNYGFKPVFSVVIVLYLLSILLYYLFFWRGKDRAVGLPAG